MSDTKAAPMLIGMKRENKRKYVCCVTEAVMVVAAVCPSTLLSIQRFRPLLARVAGHGYRCPPPPRPCPRPSHLVLVISVSVVLWHLSWVLVLRSNVNHQRNENSRSGCGIYLDFPSDAKRVRAVDTFQHLKCGARGSRSGFKSKSKEGMPGRATREEELVQTPSWRC